MQLGSQDMEIRKPRLIVVSNRLPFTLVKDEDGGLVRICSASGLVTAVSPVVKETNGLWVGWPGPDYSPGKQIPEPDRSDTGLASSQVVPVHLTDDDFKLYYNGCCNGTFWPVFHSMPDRAVFEEKFWVSYMNVNELFAQETLSVLRSMDKDPDNIPLIWIHDYHLMLAANTIRNIAKQENLSCKIGFFLHIPFPSWDIFKILPWADLVLQGMLGCDLVGFHIPDYCMNFLECCQRGLGSRVDKTTMEVELGKRIIVVKSLPIGIPFSRFRKLSLLAPDSNWPGLKVILGVDRLDYTKGLENRFKAYERLLTEYPEFQEKVMMFQVAVPSRTDIKEYQELKERMDMLVGQINGKFSTARWSPIRYIYGTVPQTELAGFYRDSDVALITPLRDGINLVAKEFVACRTGDPGVLILSAFAGAGSMMHEALIVNPYEIGNVANVLARALRMPEDEREVRMNALTAREKIKDVNFWMNSFLQSIGPLTIDTIDTDVPNYIGPTHTDEFDDYLGQYVGQEAILSLLLDYDGTLSPIASHPDLATLPPETRAVLERLTEMPDVFVAVVSGRSVQNVMKMVNIKGITYAGNHGLEIVHPDGSKFTHPIPTEMEEKVGLLLRRLQEECCKDGAWVENKGVLLTYHFRNVSEERRDPLVTRAKELITEAGFRIGSAHCALESKPPVSWDKGRASIYILRTAFGVDWSQRVRILYAGDDVTDEDAIMALKGLAVTFRVVNSSLVQTAADRRLPNTDSVLSLLKWVEKHMEKRKPRILNGHDIINHHQSTRSDVHIPSSD